MNLHNAANDESNKVERRGGSRKGAGRKPGVKKRKKQVSLYLTDQQWEALEKEAATLNSTIGNLLNQREEAHANELAVKYGLNESTDQSNMINESE